MSESRRPEEIHGPGRILAQPGIHGRAWCGPSGQDPWRFTLIVDPAARAREDIEWSALLPSERLTGWLSPDPTRRTMTIDPLSSYPD